jgi:ABC-type uncharacterized transport system permease subunit
VSDIVIHGVTAALYAGLALHFWNTRWRAPAPEAKLRPWERGAIFAALMLHAWCLVGPLLVAEVPTIGFAFALSSMLWMAVLFYWAESFFMDLEALQPIVLGLAAAAAPLTALFPGRVPLTTSPEFWVHLSLVVLSSGILTIAMLHAVLMALVERLLHRAHGDAVPAPGSVLLGPLAKLPPLLTMERLLFFLIGLGFALLTLTLITGMALSETLFGHALRFNHETLFAVVAWVVFGVLLAGRFFYGWRGRVAMRWALAGFLMVVLAGVGSRFVLEVILGRS